MGERAFRIGVGFRFPITEAHLVHQREGFVFGVQCICVGGCHHVKENSSNIKDNHKFCNVVVCLNRL